MENMVPFTGSPISGEGYVLRQDSGPSGTLGIEGPDDEFFMFDENGNQISGGEYGEEYNSHVEQVPTN